MLLRSPGTEVARVHKTETQSNFYIICRKHHTLDNNKMATIWRGSMQCHSDVE